MADMDFEIEFLPVGDASKAGDSIAIRYGSQGIYEVIVIDGGTGDSGEALVEHIKAVYGANTVIEHAICTHPDNDHASGLRKVLELLPVKNLWIHGVWHHASEMLPYYEDKKLTVEALHKKLRAEYPIVEELITLARAQQTSVFEPFEGRQIGPFTVLSPTQWAYARLVPQFRKGPAPDIEFLKKENMWLGEITQRSIFAQILEKAAEKVITWVSERWEVELLKEGAITAAENETSTVLHGQFGTSSVLLTADAGANALWWACDSAQRRGIDFSTLHLVQVPHHGSRSNVTPTVLDRLLGPKLARGSPETRKAIVSAPKDDSQHPRKMVLNSFLRRGAGVRSTQGARYRYHSGTMPARSNEKAAEVFGFFDQVEDYD
jgi:beta-lactamase superfamily II metal-dependent hydrolase